MLPFKNPTWLTAAELRKYGYKLSAIALGGALFGIAVVGIIDLVNFIHKL